MKIVHRSDTLLVLEDRPWVIGVFMIAMALMFLAASMAVVGRGEILGGFFLALVGGGVPILIAAFVVQQVRLTLDRSSGQLVRISRSVRGLTRQEFALSRLVEARVGVNYDSDGNTYRTELHLQEPAEKVPFTSYYTNGRKPEQMAEAVNDWMTTPDGNLAPKSAVGAR